jgi:hypothetical protein
VSRSAPRIDSCKHAVENVEQRTEAERGGAFGEIPESDENRTGHREYEPDEGDRRWAKADLGDHAGHRVGELGDPFPGSQIQHGGFGKAR